MAATDYEIQAGAGRRFGAVLVDLIPLAVIQIVVQAIYNDSGSELVARQTLVYAMYHSLSCHFFNGQSIGMKVAKIKMVAATGEKASMVRVFFKAITLSVCLVSIFLAIINIIPLLFGKEKTTVLDGAFKLRMVLAEPDVEVSTGAHGLTPEPVVAAAPVPQRPMIRPPAPRPVGSDSELNDVYAMVAEEVAANKFERGLLARATVESEGDEKKKTRLYLQYRVAQVAKSRRESAAE